MKPNVLFMWGFWIGLALVAYLDTIFAGGRYADVYSFLSVVFITVLMFTWFLYDAQANAYRPSVGLKIAVIAVAFIAIPYYLVRCKGWKRAGISFLRFLGLLILFAAYLTALSRVLGI